MRILFCGDVMGRSGREAIAMHIPSLKKELHPDFIIVNGENAAHGFGITGSICQDLYQTGVDVITTGNHIWDQKEIIPYIDKEKRLLRPMNYPAQTPGAGYTFVYTPDGRSLLVANVMGRLFMDPLDDPFAALDTLLGTYKLGSNVTAILIDFHGEASSEKMAAAYYCDGRVSALIGTHTHVPTADYRLLPGGTAYQTDVGMTGDYNSVIGMKKEVPIERFVKKFSKDRLSVAEEEATLCAVFIETDDTTGRATTIYPIRRGGVLPQQTLKTQKT